MKIKLSKGNNKISISLILLLSFAIVLLLNYSCGDNAATKKLLVLFENLSSDDGNEIRSLLKSGANVNARNKEGEPLLFVASKYGHTRIVKLLIGADADVNMRETISGATPLLAASINGHTKAVKMLLDADADVNISDIPSGVGYKKYSVISEEPHFEILRLLGVGGATPLWWASMHGRIEITKLLLEANADVNIPDKTNGVSPIYVAASDGHTHIVRLLIESNANVDVAARNGGTPLFWACLRKRPELVKMLLNAGADVNTVTLAKDSTEHTPLSIAEGYPKLIQILKEFGAKE